MLVHADVTISPYSINDLINKDSSYTIDFIDTHQPQTKV